MIEGFSIIIPVYKDLEGLQVSIADIKSSKIPICFEIIVCNDGADIKVSSWCDDSGIKCINIQAQKGSYYARNRGIEAASFEHLLFVDADVIVKANWFLLVEDMIERNDYIAFQINILESSNSSLLKQYSPFIEFQTEKYWVRQHFGPTAFLWVAKSVFSETGLFDERLQSGGDLELGNRCWNARKKMAYVPNSLIYHKPRSIKAKFKKYVRVLNGQKQLLQYYPNRVWHISPVSFKGLLKIPLRLLKTSLQLRKTAAFQSGKMNLIQVLWCEFWHQLSYFWAYFAVLLKN